MTYFIENFYLFVVTSTSVGKVIQKSFSRRLYSLPQLVHAVSEAVNIPHYLFKGGHYSLKFTPVLSIVSMRPLSTDKEIGKKCKYMKEFVR